MSSKDLKALARKCRREGWTVEQTNGSHMKWIHPEHGFFFSSLSPSDSRVVIKLKKQVEKMNNGTPNNGR